MNNTWFKLNNISNKRIFDPKIDSGNLSPNSGIAEGFPRDLATVAATTTPAVAAAVSTFLLCAPFQVVRPHKSVVNN